MIGIYVLLLLAMWLVAKFCKKTLKVILGVIIVLITCYCVILNIDMNMVKNCREPIFAKENGHMGSMIRYDGLGYKVGLEKDEYSNVTAGQLTILNWYLVQVNRVIDYIDDVKRDNEVIEIEYYDCGDSIEIYDLAEISKIKNILESYKYDEEPCEGIFTHTIKVNNEIYYLLEDCKEINYKGKQAKISEDDLQYIVMITKQYLNNMR